MKFEIFTAPHFEWYLNGEIVISVSIIVFAFVADILLKLLRIKRRIK